MRRDTIFRVASIAKPVTAVAAMTLVVECELRLDDSIEPWLPELANRRVLKSLSSEIDDTVPAHRAITVRDLLSVSSESTGIGCDGLPRAGNAVQRAGVAESVSLCFR